MRISDWSSDVCSSDLRSRCTTSAWISGPRWATTSTSRRWPRERHSTATPPSSTRSASSESPTGLLLEHTQHRLAYDLVGEGVVATMEAAAAHVAVEPLEPAALQHPAPADHTASNDAHPLGPLHAPPHRRKD